MLMMMMMDSGSTKEVNGHGGFVNKKPITVASLDGLRVEEEEEEEEDEEEEEEGHVNGEDDSVSKSLLPPRRGGMSRKSDNRTRSRRRVQWNDKNGKKLFEVLEYEPSELANPGETSITRCGFFWPLR
ncbi:hypothetical protein PIB30_025695 [Stylosanthes scabra]|uniref:Uncharacterized protein n=1 Tax=Stylosanthes scabra TaxID=79078 RepID=A0ABU6XA84_9FABA|nr:hypothetical protein [Stylosanthes scabra]